jgi:Flp pilus assembly protein CpaB
VNRLAVIAVAALVALGSGFGLVQYVGGAESRAAEKAAPVPILVATVDLPDGTSFDDALADGRIAQSQTLRASVAPTAITDVSLLAGSVTDGILRAGQVIVEGSFIDPEESAAGSGPPTFADDLPEGSVAVSFEASGASAVSNLISPGDRVNLLVNVPNAAELGLPDSGGPAVVHVFQDLEIIAIGTAVRPAEGATEAVANPGASSYTVAVAARDAARLLFLTRQYEVLLALVGPGNEPAPQPPVDKTDALPRTLSPETPDAESAS